MGASRLLAPGRSKERPSSMVQSGGNLEGDAGASSSPDAPPPGNAQGITRREEILARWRQGELRLSRVHTRWRAAYNDLVTAVHRRLQRYTSVDLLLTVYFQNPEFAAEAVRSLFPKTIHAWDLILIEDAAWGKRLDEMEVQLAHQRALASRPDNLARGREYRAQGDWERARAAFRAAVQAMPNCAEGWRELALVLGALGEWRWAQDAFERAHKREPTEEDEALLEEIRTIRRTLRKLSDRPSDAALHLRLGALLMAWEHGDDALFHLTRAVQLAPEWPLAHLYLGMEYHVREEWCLAEQAYVKALAANPADPEIRRLLEACRSNQMPAMQISA